MGLTSEDKLWAGLSYAGGICWFVGIPPLIIFFLKREESDFIRFHSLQACGFAIFWLLLFFLSLLLGLLIRIPVIGGPISFLLMIAPMFYWIFLMIAAFSGRDHRIPLMSEYIESRLMG